ncbi:MAG: 3,4-dihydroxy-2-butanone-4-phosphate synthase, partial [Nonlabens sp.]
EIMNEDGSMARLPQLIEVAKKHNLKLVSIEDLVAYRMKHDSLIVKKEDFMLKTRFGEYRLRAYQQTTNDQIHIALTLGDWEKEETVLTRMNSTQVNNDLFSTLTSDADRKIDAMFDQLNKEGKGAIVFINQQFEPENMLGRLEELKELQENGGVKAPRRNLDNKDYGIGAQILHDLDITKIKLMTNSEQSKRIGIIGYGLEIMDTVSY